jgi:uncharacterized protein (TIGR02246 family)
MVEPNSTEVALTDIVEALRHAWNTHDGRAFAAVFAEDADFTNVFGISAKGRPRIEQTHIAIFSTVFKDSRWTQADTRIRLIRPDVAMVDVCWDVDGSLDPEGKPWPKRRSLMNVVATQDHGRWAIAAFHNMDLPSAERTKAAEGLWPKRSEDL